MKAFVSYSLNQTELYVISILAKKLNEQGLVVSSSYSQSRNEKILNFTSFSQIIDASIFIGLISSNSKEMLRVFEEWKVANKNNIPALLLVEDNIKLIPELENHQNTIRFNRSCPEQAVENVRNKIDKAKNQKVNENNNNVAAWVLGGIGLLVMIGLLSKDK